MENDVQMSVAKTEGNMPGMMMPRGKFPGGNWGAAMQDMEMQTEFTISAGGNMFIMAEEE